MIECCKSGYVIPNRSIIRMKNVGSVFVDVDSFHFFSIGVAGNMGTSVDDKDGFTLIFGLSGKYGSVKPGADNQIIIHWHVKSFSARRVNLGMGLRAFRKVTQPAYN